MARRGKRCLQEGPVAVRDQTDGGADEVGDRLRVAGFRHRDAFWRVLHHLEDSVDVSPGEARVHGFERIEHREVRLSVLDERNVGDRGVGRQEIHLHAFLGEVAQFLAHNEREKVGRPWQRVDHVDRRLRDGGSGRQAESGGNRQGTQHIHLVPPRFIYLPLRLSQARARAREAAARRSSRRQKTIRSSRNSIE